MTIHTCITIDGMDGPIIPERTITTEVMVGMMTDIR